MVKERESIFIWQAAFIWSTQPTSSPNENDTQTHACTQTCTHTFYTHKHTHTGIHTYVHSCTPTYTHELMSCLTRCFRFFSSQVSNTNTQIHTHTHTHTLTQIHVQAYTNSLHWWTLHTHMHTKTILYPFTCKHTHTQVNTITHLNDHSFWLASISYSCVTIQLCWCSNNDISWKKLYLNVKCYIQISKIDQTFKLCWYPLPLWTVNKDRASKHTQLHLLTTNTTIVQYSLQYPYKKRYKKRLKQENIKLPILGQGKKPLQQRKFSKLKEREKVGEGERVAIIGWQRWRKERRETTRFGFPLNPLSPYVQVLALTSGSIPTWLHHEVKPKASCTPDTAISN